MATVSDLHVLSKTSPVNHRAWWFLLALVASAIFWLLAWYGDTLQSMIAMWQQSETFAHGFLIAPISAWLVWRQRDFIQTLDPRPNYWMLFPLAVVGFGWSLGQLATVVVVQQYCLVIMILLLVATVLGNRIVKQLAFPLLFLLFAVPFGEFLLPILMEHTANFTVFALRLTGIPVYREGLYFTLPSGNWSVVEACSGLRYLIASLTLGVLYAYLTYRRLSRRMIFVVLSIVVPVVANWLRAYMIVMIGHLSSMKLATGVDHLIYGWLFFGIVMLILFWVGSFWREDSVALGTPSASPVVRPISRPEWTAIVAATIISAGVAIVSPLVISHLQQGSYRAPALQPVPGLHDWQPDAGSLTDWAPRFLNPSAHIIQVYANGAKRVELYVGYYRNQRRSAQLITSQNSLVYSNDKVWGKVGETRRVVSFGNDKIDLIETQLKSPATRILVWHWYWIDGQYTANQYWAKLLQAKSQLLGRGDDGAVIVVSTESDLKGEEASGRLEDFVRSMLPAISKSLQNAR